MLKDLKRVGAKIDDCVSVTSDNASDNKKLTKLIEEAQLKNGISKVETVIFFSDRKYLDS